MVRHIVAVDIQNGIAKDGKIPWHLEGDSTYFLENIKKFGSQILVASITHEQIGRPIAEYTYVWSHRDFSVEKGEVVHNLSELFNSLQGDLWVIGGAALYNATIDIADELYITRIDKDFNCDRFYPHDLSAFTLISRSEPVAEHGTNYSYEVHRRISLMKD